MFSAQESSIASRMLALVGDEGVKVGHPKPCRILRGFGGVSLSPAAADARWMKLHERGECAQSPLSLGGLTGELGGINVSELSANNPEFNIWRW